MRDRLQPHQGVGCQRVQRHSMDRRGCSRGPFRVTCTVPLAANLIPRTLKVTVLVGSEPSRRQRQTRRSSIDIEKGSTHASTFLDQLIVQPVSRRARGVSVLGEWSTKYDENHHDVFARPHIGTAVMCSQRRPCEGSFGAWPPRAGYIHLTFWWSSQFAALTYQYTGLWVFAIPEEAQ